MALNDVKELAICQVLKNGSTFLLIKSDDGINKGKWNAPSGEVQKGESPAKAAMRHVFQQTGLYVSKVTSHGTIRLFLNGKNEFNYLMHVFSTKLFSGDLKPNIKGEAKWFNAPDLPYYEMWADDKYWVNLVLQGKEFDADFFFDEKNEKITKYRIKERQKIFAKIFPVIIIAAIIGVVGFSVFSFRGVLFGGTGKNSTISASSTVTALRPPANTTASSTSTTIQPTTAASTTIAPPPTQISIDNIDLTVDYSGPAAKNNVQCNVPTKSEVINYHRIISNTTFLINMTFTDQGCYETITSIYTTTPGFKVVSVQPVLPVGLPPYSQMYFDIRLTSTNTTYSGPLTIIEEYN
jgi:8-oxo-dGTP pyrophosphatase MutT (NUDIX family)